MAEESAESAQDPLNAPRSTPCKSAIVTDFLTLLDRPRTPLEDTFFPLEETPSLQIQCFEFDSEVGRRVAGISYAPIETIEPTPLVIVLHGTGKSKEDLRVHLEHFASRGFTALSIDARHHGRGVPRGTYEEAMLEAFRGARSFPYLYDTVWDVLRLLDFLESWAARDPTRIDPTRIALVGISKGGSEAILAAAVDERVGAVAPLIGVQSFAMALDHDAWQARAATFQSAVNQAAASEGSAVDAAFFRRFLDRIAPGLVDRFDGPTMVPLIAPRPIFIVNGALDPRTPLFGVEATIEAARLAYRHQGAERALSQLIQEDTGHEVRPEAWQAVADWLANTF